MITFAFLFLGLILGPHDVELLVEGNIAEVHVLLDGESVGELTEEPWRIECDFGPQLEPHTLVAVGYDAAGDEIARAVQRINLPRERAEAALLLEGADPAVPEWVRLVWQHMEYQAAERIEFRFDGKKIPTTNDRAQLPRFDPAQLHSLEASIHFPDGVRYQSELTIGGQTMFGAETEITGLVMVGSNRDLPDLKTLEGRFRSRGEPVRVVGVERSPARVAMVVDQTAVPALRKLGEYGSALTNRRTALRPGEELVFLFPEVRKVETKGVPSRLFSITQDFTSQHGSSIPSILTRIAPPDSEPSPYRRVSDAVAVAGIEAAKGNRPRAVVLVLGTETEETSAFTIDEVRRFLAQLEVPLFVWWTGPRQAETTTENRRRLSQQTPWGKATDISSFTRMVAATTELREDLDRQMTVWIEGSYLPNEIELAAGVKGLRPAG